MKTKLVQFAALLATAGSLSAAVLTATTAVHTQPTEASPSVTFLKAGTEPVNAPGTLATTPAGWMAVELPGPFEGYVLNRDIQKSLDVRTGAQIHLAPKQDSGVLTTMEPGDKAAITGLEGKWTQIHLEKKIVGYIRFGGAPGYLPPIATAPAATPHLVDVNAAAPLSPSPVTPIAYGVATAGRPAPMVNLGDGGSSTLPRLFQGRFVSTRSPFRPRRPYDWALNDEAGTRFAYVDISKLLLTEQIEKYTDHLVVVYGAAKATPDGKEIVIAVESLQLK
jgi:hypothetical protein